MEGKGVVTATGAHEMEWAWKFGVRTGSVRIETKKNGGIGNL